MNEHEKVEAIIRMKDGAPLEVDPRRSALLVIDVQRYFVHPHYSFGRVLEKLVPGSTAGYFERVQHTVVPAIQALLECFRGAGLPVIFTGTGSYSADGRELPGWLKDFDHLGLALLGERVWPQVSDPAWQIDESVVPREGDLVLHKISSGPVNSTKIDQILHNLGITTLFVTGLTTDVCVAQTAREAADRGFQVIVVEDACTTLSEEMHRAALQAFQLAFGRVRDANTAIGLVAPDRESMRTAS